MYYTEHEPKNYQWRRPGNEATNGKNNFLHDFLMPTRITFLYLVDELKQSCLVFFSSMYRSGPILAIEPVVFSVLTLLGFCEAETFKAV